MIVNLTSEQWTVVIASIDSALDDLDRFGVIPIALAGVDKHVLLSALQEMIAQLVTQPDGSEKVV